MELSCPLPSVDELLHEKFAVLLAECDLVADTAGHGQTLDFMEAFFSDKGRKFLKETFEQKLQERVNRTETTSEAKECPNCKKKAIPKQEDEDPNHRSRTSHP